MTSEQQLKAATAQAAQWQRVAQAANERAAVLERERDAATAHAAELQAELAAMRQRVRDTSDMLISQMDAEANQAQRASTAEARTHDANASSHWRSTHDAKCQEVQQLQTQLDTVRQHIERTGADRQGQIEAGAATMRWQIAAVIDTYPNRRAASEIAARVRAMPLPTVAEVDQANGSSP